MATPIRDAMINNSSKDGTGDAIEGSEVDANPNTIADLLDGTSTTVWGQAGQVSFEAWGIKEDAVAAGAVKDKWIYEWDPSDGSNLTDNSSGLGMVWKMPDDADNQTEFANLDIMCNDDAASSEDAEFVFSTVINATMREVFSVGSQGATFNEASQDLDFRIETDNIANGFIADAGLDVFAFGAAAADDKFVTISPPAASHTATNDTYALYVTAGGAQTIPSGTTALVASLAVEEPNITATGTVTNAATVYIKNAPTEGGTGNYALWIDAGASQLDGTLTVGANTDGHDVKLFGNSSGQYVLWDESADELVLAGDTKLSFHDAAGGENIIASADGHLEINAGTTLDITATTIDLNGAVAMDGAITGGTNITISGELDAATLDISGNADIAGDLTLSAGADGALQFTNAGENSIKIPDNQATALIIEEANNNYLTFITTNSGEKIHIPKPLQLGSLDTSEHGFINFAANMYSNIDSTAGSSTAAFIWGKDAEDWTGTELMRLNEAGNLGLGTGVFGSSAANVFAIANGTAPGTSANKAQLYVISGELIVKDGAGNATTLSPHNFGDRKPSEEMAWSYQSKRGKKSITVDMLRVVRLLEKLTGEQLAYIEEAA